MEVTIRRAPGVKVTFHSESLDVARLVASTFGYDVDIEPGEPGKNKLTATDRRTGHTVTANGTSPTVAAEKLIELLTGGAKSG